MTNSSDRAVQQPETISASELQPMLAGAYARGLADMLFLLNIPAFLVGQGGFVLHANTHVAAHLGAGLGVDSGRLTVADARARATYGEALAGLSGRIGDYRRTVRVPGADDSSVNLHVIAIPGDSSAGQLVQAVVLIDDGQVNLMPGVVDAMIAGMDRAATAGKPRH